MTALYYTLGVVIFAVAIMASIGLHEFGHLIPAKKFGGKVTQWFVGFGPTLWSKKIGETEYGVKAIPLGGYVKIVGMLPPGHGADGDESRIRQSNTGMFTQLISDARAAEWEHIGPEDRDRLFYKRKWWQKVVVMAGGPMVNIAIAFFLFWGVFATVGVLVDAKTETVVAEVVPCIVPADEDDRACTAEELRDHPTPAAAAGLQPGDRFVSFNGEQITSWEQVQAAIRANDNGTATIVVDRDGSRLTLEATTQVQPRPIDGDSEELTPVGFLGVLPVQTPIYETGGPIFTAQQMGTMTVDVVKSLAELPVKVYGVARAIVGLEERDREGPVSVVGGGRLAGEVAAHEEIVLGDKVTSLVMLIAGFNLFIGLFNFLPLLPLDGGHIAGALYEAVRRGWARLRGHPDPGYADVAKLLPVAYVMGLAMLVMGVVLIIGDLVVPVHLTS
ncbi:M50 family metallopeptidase [Nocardioides piscis]|uniref:Site-2 protease family protein n=1 Tax=Nocardioides piscis TaxID=2714938 RepID=A0A6G7YJP0_9ACTN|nr:site-2 protease family protein [Nocardioides piscis]QIK76950.1 site-2 protease family protein [Nocardioides piscis]